MAHSHTHDHVHDGSHAHAHAQGNATSTRALAWALGLTFLILAVEAIGGLVSNSLALLADAGHVLTDAGALGLSLFVAWLSRQPSAAEKTYGYLRWEILAALINGATLLGISAWIVIEALQRFRHPEHVAGGVMLAAASLGLVVNGVAARLLHGAHDHSLNVRGAYLHVLGDMLASFGTVVAAFVIRYDAARFDATTEEIPIADARLRPVWGTRLARIVLVAKDRALRGEHHLTIGYAP